MRIPTKGQPTLDHYVVVQPIAQGDIGAVWEGYDRRTELPVAIKVIAPGFLGEPEAVRRLMRETAILSSLNHRNIVHCVEVVQTRNGQPAIVMELLSGVPLSAFEGRPYPELLPLLIQTLMGAGYLKSKSIVHRDLSMMNVMVVLENQRRLVKIVDFGVAKLLSDVTTRPGLATGKLAFTAPELFLSGKVDWRSDVYSLGVIFHRLLTGRPPLTVAHEDNYYEWATAHQSPPALSLEPPAGLPPLPEELEAVVRMMLAADPAERGQGYDGLIATLDRIQRETWRKGLEPSADLLSTLPEPPAAPAASTLLDAPAQPDETPVPSAPAATPSGDLQLTVSDAERDNELRRRARALFLLASAILLLAFLLGLAWWLSRVRLNAGGRAEPAPARSVPGRGIHGDRVT